LRLLDNAGLKTGLKVLWFATGKDDGLITTTQGTVDLFKKHGFTRYSRSHPAGIPGLTVSEYGLPPPRYRLPDRTHLGPVRLQVRNLARSVEY
jgi:hypothetical protein